MQVSLLEQNPPMEDDATVLEQVFLHFPKEFRELNEYEAKSMLNKLGLPDYEQKVGTLSGGQRKRVALAAALIHPADVLVLDEPTNHLDAEMTAWLEDWLRRFKGGLVMVTHDRYFSGAGGEPYHGAEPGQAVSLRGQLFQISGAEGPAGGDGGGQRAEASVYPADGAGVDHAGLRARPPRAETVSSDMRP